MGLSKTDESLDNSGGFGWISEIRVTAFRVLEVGTQATANK